MLFLSSPAKRLDFSLNWNSQIVSEAAFVAEADVLARVLSGYGVEKLAKKLQVSQKLAELNFARYQDWDSTNENQLKPALLAYQGDVYKALDTASLDLKSQKYLQSNLRILSGMYGLLKPYDVIQAYRLEMRLKLGESHLDSLYKYWSKKITSELNTQLASGSHDYCVNLASQEYSKAIDLKNLSRPLINIKFTQLRNGTIKSIGLLNKRARGLMLRYAAQTEASSLDDLALFTEGGYRLVTRSDLELVFLSE